MSDEPKPDELADYISELRRDPYDLDHVLGEFCRLFLEEDHAIPEQALPLLAERFLAYLAHVEAQAKPKGKGKWGTQRVGRMMHKYVDLLGFSLETAAKLVARSAKVEPDSAIREYWRFRATDKSR